MHRPWIMTNSTSDDDYEDLDFHTRQVVNQTRAVFQRLRRSSRARQQAQREQQQDGGSGSGGGGDGQDDDDVQEDDNVLEEYDDNGANDWSTF